MIAGNNAIACCPSGVDGEFAGWVKSQPGRMIERNDKIEQAMMNFESVLEVARKQLRYTYTPVRNGEE